MGEAKYLMTLDQLNTRLTELAARYDAERDALLAEARTHAQYQVGDKVQRERNDGVPGIITGRIVDIRPGVYDDKLAIHYAVHLDPTDYHSRQSSARLDIPLGQYDDFFQGSAYWTKVVSTNQTKA